MPLPEEKEKDFPGITDPLQFFREDTIVDEKTDEELAAEKKEREDRIAAEKLAKEKGKEKNPEDNLNTLRKQRDQARKENEDLKKELESIKPSSELKPLNKIAEYLKTKKGGALTDEVVDEYINKNKKRKNDLTEKERAILEKENKIKELDITQSAEYKEKALIPLDKARDNLFATFGNPSADGKTVKHANLVSGLLQQICVNKEDGSLPTAIEIRSALEKFAEAYETRTGEAYKIPPLTVATEAVHDFINKSKFTVDIKANWDKSLEESKKEKAFNEAQRNESLTKKEIKDRDFLYHRVLEGLDDNSFIDKEKFETYLQEEHNVLVAPMRGERIEKRTYGEVLLALTKGRAYDEVMAELNKTREELKKAKENNKSGLPNNGGREGRRETVKVTKDGSPLSFLAT